MFLVSSTGDGLRAVEDEWDLPRLQKWLKYCERHPPLQVMVAAYLKIDTSEPMRVTEENFGEFMDMLKVGSKIGGST